MILQGTVQGRRKSNQEKRWKDNIPKWTGLGLGEALQKVEEKEKFRKVVDRSSLMPKQSFRLLDEQVSESSC